MLSCACIAFMSVIFLFHSSAWGLLFVSGTFHQHRCYLSEALGKQIHCKKKKAHMEQALDTFQPLKQSVFCYDDHRHLIQKIYTISVGTLLSFTWYWHLVWYTLKESYRKLQRCCYAVCSNPSASGKESITFHQHFSLITHAKMFIPQRNFMSSAESGKYLDKFILVIKWIGHWKFTHNIWAKILNHASFVHTS